MRSVFFSSFEFLAYLCFIYISFFNEECDRRITQKLPATKEQEGEDNSLSLCDIQTEEDIALFESYQQLELLREYFVVESSDIVPPTIDQGDQSLLKEENVHFVGSDANKVVAASAPEDDSFYSDLHTDADLAGFLSRPVPIKTFAWDNTDTELGSESFDPWHDFFNDLRIRKKIDNYNFISCNLHLKFVFNASPFLAGLAKMTYLPLSGYTPESVPIGTTSAAVIPLSQRMHVDLIPQDNSGGELVLPFFYHKNWLDITSAKDLKDMGRIRPLLVAALTSANGVPATVNVTCYAWAEKVRICGPTLELAVQSVDMLSGVTSVINAGSDALGYKKQIQDNSAGDEYGTGPVQKVSSAIAGISAAASAIPLIAPFATATSAVASAVSWVASLFGWTNVPVIEDVRPYKSLTHHSLASASIGEPVEKLTIDPKNELTVDPRTVGLDGTDELALHNIIERDSVLTVVGWSNSDLPDTALFSVGVIPSLFDIVDAGTPQEAIYSTPMGHIQWLFKNWHGDMIFTFHFLNTQYHKGRVRITWDPTGDAIATAETTTSSFTQIVDLGEAKKVEVRVPFLQALPWLETRADLNSAPWFSPNATTSTVSNHEATGFTNGTITMRVVNGLSGPQTTAFIRVAVYVRAAENFTFGNPRSRLPQHSIYEVQSSDIIEVSTSQVSTKDDCYKSLICMGEEIRSLRTLLRRSTLNYITNNVIPSGDWIIAHRYMAHEPLYYGFDTNGVNVAAEIVGLGVSRFNFVQVTPYNWIAPLFLGRRGSHFWHFDLDTTGQGADYVGTFQIQRRQDSFGPDEVSNNVSINNGSNNSVMRAFNSTTSPTTAFQRYGTGCGGAALTAQQTQAGLSVGLPMYSNRRMYFIDWDTTTTGSAVDGSDTDVFDLSYILRNTGGTGNQQNTLLSAYSSIGTDFNFFYFINVPIHYTYNGVVPNPAP